MDIFSIIPDNFFSLLSSKNKKIYLAAIIETFQVYETGSILGIDKKIIVDDLSQFLTKLDTSYTKELDFDEEESQLESKRDLANFVLRRMEECGWIYVDVTNDYQEILNFTDYAITVVEALMKIGPSFFDPTSAGEYDDYYNRNEYQGYIYTIYSLITNPNPGDYGILMSQIYTNTKLLIRSLRKLDSRLKDYISSVVENSEIKDLMNALISYKTELFDNSYQKLKTSDNVNKYRLTIVTKLEEYQENEEIFKSILLDYRLRFGNELESKKRAIRDINELIDVFNSLDEFIAEIDEKNKTYINSTIGKVKFLLTEDDNVIGKLNNILKFVKQQNKLGKVDKAINTISPLFHLKGNRMLNTSSLYSPRGNYVHNQAQYLDSERLADLDITGDFLKQFETPYNEVEVGKNLKSKLQNGVLQASNWIQYSTPANEVIRIIYMVLFAGDHAYNVTLLNEYIYNQHFMLKDFIIERIGD